MAAKKLLRPRDLGPKIMPDRLIERGPPPDANCTGISWPGTPAEQLPGDLRVMEFPR